MPQIINTNIASLTAQRNLNNSQTSLATALQRLSSGARINSAKDDAAGLAISDRFTTQIRGLNQAIRNANDGISLAQTGEGALAEVGNNLQRIRELAVQAANDTNSDSDRAALDLEVQQRLAELERITSQTSFNGRKILDGSFGEALFMVGADAGQDITLNLEASTRLDSLGSIARATSEPLPVFEYVGTRTASSSHIGFGFDEVPATSGYGTFQLDNVNFGTPDYAGTSGTTDFTLSTLNFAPGSSGDIVLSGPGPFDFTGLNQGTFQVDNLAEPPVTILLDKLYTNMTQVVNDIQTQLGLDPNYNNIQVNNLQPASDGFSLTNQGKQNALVVGSADANAQAIASLPLAPVAGVTGGPNPNAYFEIDGISVPLDTTFASDADFASYVDGLLTSAGSPYSGYTVTPTGGGGINIDKNIIGSTAVNIANQNPNAIASGIVGAGTAGTPQTFANNGGFTLNKGATDETPIVLDSNYGSYGAVVSAINAQIDTSAFTVGVDGSGLVTITRTSTGFASLRVRLSDEVVNSAGASTYSADDGASGSNMIPSTEANFKVDGTSVRLDFDYDSYDGLREDIQRQLGEPYTVTGRGRELIITNNEIGSEAVVISEADFNADSAGITNGRGTLIPIPTDVVINEGDFFIQVGDEEPVAITGSYSTVAAIAEEINTQLSGVYAMATEDGRLTFSSEFPLTFSGAEAGIDGIMGFDPLEIPADNGDLTDINILDVAHANDVIIRMNAALTEISTLRSSFGAIQSRFESTIANQATTTENLTASRSRIMDADFAAETAALTRAQILQQAGVAMTAQANQVPQNVLSLLQS